MKKLMITIFSLLFFIDYSFANQNERQDTLPHREFQQDHAYNNNSMQEQDSMDTIFEDVQKMRRKMSKFMKKMQKMMNEDIDSERKHPNMFDDNMYSSSSNMNNMGSQRNSMQQGKQQRKNKNRFKMQFDMQKTKNHLIVSCDLPGMEKDKIDISINENKLIISGERKQEEYNEQENEQENQSFYRSTRSYGSFSKSIRLPKGIDENKIKADYKNGVLIIKIKYKEPEQKKSKKIKID